MHLQSWLFFPCSETSCPTLYPHSIAHGLYCCQGPFERYEVSEDLKCLGAKASWETSVRCGQFCIPCPSAVCSNGIDDPSEGDFAHTFLVQVSAIKLCAFTKIMK